MSFISDFFSDIRDVVSGQAFDVDYADPSIPLKDKLQNHSAMVILVGHKYAKVAIASLAADGKVVVEDERQFTEPTMATSKDLFLWVFEQTELRELERKHKIKKYIVGMYPDHLDTMVVDCKVDDLGLVAKWDQDQAKYIQEFSKSLLVNPEDFINRIPKSKYSPEMHYGHVMLPKIGKALIFSGQRNQISPIIEEVNKRGHLIRFSLYPVQLFAALMEEGVLEDKDLGCAFIYGNRTITTVGWRWDDNPQVFVKVRRVGQEQTTPKSAKDSLLGKMVQTALQDWTKMASLNTPNGKILPEKLGFYYLEVSGSEEAKVLETVLRELIGERIPNIHALNFHKIFDICARNGSSEPLLEILPLLK